tara:strand:+ start:381 stop:776 length:396 start_codon:yes stop_codon:yes gene_type:complete
MTSELKVDKFTGVTTAGSIDVTGEGNSTTTNLQQGLAKAWNKFQGDASSIAVDDSFNVSSLEDVGTGQYRSIYTNNMNNDDYAHSVNSAFFSGVGSDTDTTTSRIRYFNANSSATDADAKEMALIIMGDLA